MSVSDMTTADEAQSLHAGFSGSLNAKRRIFNYYALFGRCLHLFGSEKEKIGRGLASCDHGRTEEVASETRNERSHLETETDPLW